MRIPYINRFQEIISILSQYGFGFIVEKFDLPFFFTLADEEILKISRGTRIRLMLEKLGTTYIKLGQILSTRQDIFPQDIIEELQKLQDTAPSEAFEDFEKPIKETFGDLKRVFKKFDKKPLASASIAQVHYGVLKNNKAVVVKIRRPNLEEKINKDIELMKFLAELLEKYFPQSKDFSPVNLIEEFEKSLMRELRLDREAKNIARFRKQFANDPLVNFPEVYWQYTSSDVLTMEFVEGVKIDRLKNLQRSNGYRPKEIALRGARAIFKQIFEHGFFHADPHAGNVLVGHDNSIYFLDSGMVGYLNEDSLNLLADLISAIIQRKEQTIIELFLDHDLLPENCPISLLKKDIHELLVDYYGLPLERIPISDFLQEIIQVSRRYRILFPPHFLLLIKTLLTIDGIGRQLDPQFNPIEEVKPFIISLLKRRFHPKRLAEELWFFTQDSAVLMRELPRDLRTIMKYTKKDGFPIKLQANDLNNLSQTLDRASNRLAFSLVVVALLVSSSLVVLKADLPAVFLGIPALALLGYLGAVICSFILLWLITRRPYSKD